MSAQEPLRRIASSITLRIVLLTVLSLFLLIPLESVRSLVYQRQSLRTEAAASIAEGWGNRQTLLGPVLVLQAGCKTLTENGKEVKSRHLAMQLPSVLRFDGRATSEVRKRGIHQIPVYRAHLDVAFEIVPPALSELDWGCNETRIEAASIVFALSDARGIDKLSPLEIAGSQEPWSAGTPLSGEWATGVQAAIAVAALYPSHGPVKMHFTADLRGTDRLAVAPAGGSTELKLASDWPDPSFDGMFLPTERRLRPDGYEASWTVSELARPVRALWLDGGGSTELAASAFGVSWFQPAAGYLMTERSLKYGFLFVALTFLTFFLFELGGMRRAHILQYGLVGGALCVFYLLLLSISERAGFGTSYLVAASATTAQITLYGRAFLDSGRRVAVLGSVLAALYSALYLLIGLEETALLVGAIGLFIILTITMWWTRSIHRESASPAS